MPKPNGALRAVVFRDEGGLCWVGVCLEHYIAAYGSTLRELLENLDVTIKADRKDGIAGIDAAPEQYHRMWEQHAGEVRAKIRNTVELAFCA